MSTRRIHEIIPSVATSDGAGVKLRRSLGSGQGKRLDPFLMLDEFFSDNPEDYIAGFPAHPHRGFETVTYILDGHMLHEDHMGNRGDLKAGGVQWMTAGRGIIHSEMPQQTEGRLRGFQLWINLPARDKMKPAAYRDISAAEIPEIVTASGATVRVIAGSYTDAAADVTGPIHGGATDPLYFDVQLPPGATFAQAIAEGHNAFLYLMDGTASIAGQDIPARAAALLEQSGPVEIVAGDNGARLLLLAGKPIGERVVQYGPFVMNSSEEIEQAMRDYRDGRLTDVA